MTENEKVTVGQLADCSNDYFDILQKFCSKCENYPTPESCSGCIYDELKHKIDAEYQKSIMPLLNRG